MKTYIYRCAGRTGVPKEMAGIGKWPTLSYGRRLLNPRLQHYSWRARRRRMSPERTFPWMVACGLAERRLHCKVFVSRLYPLSSSM